MNIDKNSIYELPFDKVITLYKLKEKAEAGNDIKLRTKLLAHYPELFIPETYAEIKTAHDNVMKYNANKKAAAISAFEKHPASKSEKSPL